MVEAALKGMERQGITLRIEDEAAAPGQRWLYDSQEQAWRGSGPERDDEPGKDPTGMHWDTSLEVGGRRWALRCAPTLEYLAARQSLQPWTMLAGGLLFTGLLGAFLLLITGRATIVEQLVVERTAELQAAYQELEAFSISHDLRAPLRAIHSFASILLEDHASQLDTDAQHYLQRVQHNGLRMGRLIDELLTFSRLTRQPITRQWVALADLVRQALDDLRPECEQRQVDLVLGDLPACQVDPVLLKQALVNLLGNALKFTRQREVARIEVGCREANGERIYFVQDNGVGFDMRYAHKLFGVFERLHRDEAYEGMGIGLALTQRIIQRHGGRIWAEAEVDKGAAFYFTL
jgi:light-regulated signal transduction histidine kinase (bacteriophytochrome)